MSDPQSIPGPVRFAFAPPYPANVARLIPLYITQLPPKEVPLPRVVFKGACVKSSANSSCFGTRIGGKVYDAIEHARQTRRPVANRRR